jgi:hypothetical protein
LSTALKSKKIKRERERKREKEIERERERERERPSGNCQGWSKKEVFFSFTRFYVTLLTLK